MTESGAPHPGNSLGIWPSNFPTETAVSDPTELQADNKKARATPANN